jgi:hypothetical protein
LQKYRFSPQISFGTALHPCPFPSVCKIPPDREKKLMTAKKPKREENKNKFQLKKIESRMFFGQAVKKETPAPICRKDRGRISEVNDVKVGLIHMDFKHE